MSNVKEELKELIKKVPDDITFDDMMYEIYVNHQIQKGLEQVKDGQTVTFEQAKKRLLAD